MVVDLQSIESAKKAAAEILQLTDNIDAIINNAGIMATLYQKIASGLESQLQTKHIGHSVIRESLRPNLAKDGRVVNLSSSSHCLLRSLTKILDSPMAKSTTVGLPIVNARLPICYIPLNLLGGGSNRAVHPGFVQTKLGRHVDLHNWLPKAPNPWCGEPFHPPGFDLKDPSQGSSTTLVRH